MSRGAPPLKKPMTSVEVSTNCTVKKGTVSWVCVCVCVVIAIFPFTHRLQFFQNGLVIL